MPTAAAVARLSAVTDHLFVEVLNSPPGDSREVPSQKPLDTCLHDAKLSPLRAKRLPVLALATLDTLGHVTAAVAVMPIGLVEEVAIFGVSLLLAAVVALLVLMLDGFALVAFDRALVLLRLLIRFTFCN